MSDTQKNESRTSELRDRGYSETGLIRGLVIDPMQFELWQKEVRNSIHFAQGFDKLVDELNVNPDLLIDKFQTKGKMGVALGELILHFMEQEKIEDQRKVKEDAASKERK